MIAFCTFISSHALAWPSKNDSTEVRIRCSSASLGSRATSHTFGSAAARLLPKRPKTSATAATVLAISASKRELAAGVCEPGMTRGRALDELTPVFLGKLGIVCRRQHGRHRQEFHGVDAWQRHPERFAARHRYWHGSAAWHLYPRRFAARSWCSRRFAARWHLGSAYQKPRVTVSFARNAPSLFVPSLPIERESQRGQDEWAQRQAGVLPARLVQVGHGLLEQLRLALHD